MQEGQLTDFAEYWPPGRGDVRVIKRWSRREQMNKYHLAKLIEMAGSIKTRKRVQKVAYLLQIAGLDLGVKFRLHHFGPYSAEVASLLDEMSSQGILVENRQANRAGWQSEYHLSDQAQQTLREFDKTAKGKELAGELVPFESRIYRLLAVDDLWELELGATIAYFYEKERNWDSAVAHACKFKSVPANVPKTLHALSLAKELAA